MWRQDAVKKINEDNDDEGQDMANIRPSRVGIRKSTINIKQIERHNGILEPKVSLKVKGEDENGETDKTVSLNGRDEFDLDENDSDIGHEDNIEDGLSPVPNKIVKS